MADEDMEAAPPRAAPPARAVRRPSRRAFVVAGVAVLVTLSVQLKDREYADAALYTAVVAIGAYLSTRSDEFYTWVRSRSRTVRNSEAGLVIVAVVVAVTWGGAFRLLPVLTLLIMAVRLQLGFPSASHSEVPQSRR